MWCASNGRFTPKEFFIQISSVSIALNVMILIIFLIPWIYAGLKFSIAEKIYGVLSSIFPNYECQKTQDEEANKYKY